MSIEDRMKQNYGVLRVVRVRPPAHATNFQDRYPTGWLPEERLVHLLARRVTTIGRAMSNDIILMDSTVSREHARLVLDDDGWHVVNLTEQNVVRVNGHPVASRCSIAIQPQDILVLGSTMLQLLAPQANIGEDGIGGPTLQLASLFQSEPQFRPATTNDHSHMPPFLQKRRAEQRTLRSEPQQMTQAAELEMLDNGNVRSWQRPVIPSLPGPPATSEATPPKQLAEAEPWEEEGGILEPGVTMQFALPQGMGVRTRWLIVGFSVLLLLVSAMITIALNSLIGLSALTQNGTASIITAVTVPLIPALGINLLVNFIDRFEREPWYLRLAAFLWGAVIAIPPALLIEQNIDILMQNVLGPDTSNPVRAIFQGLNAGITEETVKGLGLLLLFFVLRGAFDNVTDGIVYGALIGAGFAMAENIVYFARNQDFLVYLIVGRIVLCWLCHSTFTVCFGAALGYVRHTRVRWRQIVIPLIGFVCAVGLHTIFDFTDFYASLSVLKDPNDPAVALISLIAIISNYIPPFIAQIVLLYILIKALAHEAAVIREFLADEVCNSMVRLDEYVLLQKSFQRTKQERRVLWSSGLKQWLRVKALYQTEIGLAFRKWHVSMGDKPKRGYHQPEDVYRQRIKRLREDINVADNSREVAAGKKNMTKGQGDREGQYFSKKKWVDKK